MASENEHAGDLSEKCIDCGQQQPHEVSIDLVQESDADEHADSSREPYRIAKCQACGGITKIRMNDT
jgi:rRNA maturation protein Nop10